MLTSDAEADLFSFVNEKLPTTPINIKITINTVKHPQPVLAQPFPEVVLLPCDVVSACALYDDSVQEFLGGSDSE